MAHKLPQAADRSCHLPDALRLSINLILRSSLEHIRALERQDQRLNAALAEHMVAIPRTLDPIPGIGPLFAAGLIAEIGNINRFDANEGKVAKYAESKWRKTQSADFTTDQTRLTCTGNHYSRYYSYKAGNATRMRDVEYVAYYERKYREVRAHQ
ncbi:MAG: transposase [Ardenticatenaceae bacterium]|nr:transposase [Ardenticatenaceae bacterium]